MDKKEILKPRGVRFSDSQWDRMKSKAEAMNKKNGTSNVTASDVVRHAVDQMEKSEQKS